MHAMDHHGVYGVVFGSVVWYLCYNDGCPTPGTTQPMRLLTVNNLLKEFYRHNPAVTANVDKITMKNLKPGDGQYSELSGPTIKAAN